MLKEAIRISAAAVLLAGVIITSCSTESETARAARLLYEQAESDNIAGDPVKALSLLDSLQNTYKTETDWQRAAMKLRPTVMINATEMQIQAVDDSIAAYEQEYNTMLSRMKRIDDPRLVEPYFVDKATYDPKFMNSTAIQPRVSEIGQLYFVSSVNPGGIKHTGFSLTCDGESVQAGPVAYDGEMNYRINGSEVITYSPEQSEPVGIFADNHAGRPMTLSFTGGKSKNIKIDAKRVDAIVNCYTFSRSIVEARQLAFERERLMRQLDIAKSQAERLAGEAAE